MKVPRKTAEKIEWAGVCDHGNGNQSVQVIWEQPDGFDLGESYESQIEATNADCAAVEEYFDNVCPDSLYTGHTGYCPEYNWYENAVDDSVRKKAWYGGSENELA